MGAPPGRERKRDFVDNPNGLFSAQASPKPPAAMYSIVEGMRVGGKVNQIPNILLAFVEMCLSLVMSLFFHVLIVFMNNGCSELCSFLLKMGMEKGE